MRNRFRKLLIAVLGLTAAVAIVAPSAYAYGGCTPHINPRTLEITKVC